MSSAALPPSQDDLDLELAALFDAPATSSTPCIPPSPERMAAPPPPKRTLLSVLAERKDKLSGTAAEIAAEVAAVKSLSRSDPPPRLSIQEAMMIRRASKRASSDADALRQAEKKRRKARNAFKVVGLEKKDAGKQTFEYIDNRFSNMSLREACFPKEAMTALFEHSVRVDIADIRKLDDEMRAGKLGEFVVFGCLVKKHSKKETKAGCKYAVWSMCNMPRPTLADSDEKPPRPTVVTVLLFADAFQALHTQVEGSVFALRKPQLLPPRGSDSARDDIRGLSDYSGHCLRVRNRDFVIPLGICKDFKLCEVEGPNLSVCGDWYDANRMSHCPRHMRMAHRKRSTARRMDINNAERPGITKEALQQWLDPENISRPDYSREYSHNEERDGGSDDHKIKTAEERQKAKKLRDAKRQPRLSSTIGNSLRQLSSRKDRTGHVHRRHRPVVRTPQGMPMPPSRANETRQSGQAEDMQYLEAVEVLVRRGFILGEDGSLRAPAGHPPWLKTSRDMNLDQRKHNAALSTVEKRRENSSANTRVNVSRGFPASSPVKTSRNKEAAGVGNLVDKMTVEAQTAGNQEKRAEGSKAVAPSAVVTENQTSVGKEQKVAAVDISTTKKATPLPEELGDASLSSPKIDAASSHRGTGTVIPALGLTRVSSGVTIELEESEDE